MLSNRARGDETVYVVVYQPPQGWDISQESRDAIISTGNVLEIVRSSLYSLQWTELRLDRIARRPLTAVLYNMADRYGYAAGRKAGEGNKGEEPFEVIEAQSLRDVALICDHHRYREWPDTYTYPADPESPVSEHRKERTVEVTAFEWRHLYNGKRVWSGHKPREEGVS